MTNTIKSHIENGYYVYMEWDKENIYRVGVCPCCKDNMCEYPIYPIREMTYSINDKKNAEATYNRYIREYC